MTTTVPGSICPARMASSAPCSPSKTRAVPSKRVVSMPATLTTPPLGASEPAQHGDAAAGVDRRRERVDDLAVGRGRIEGGEVLRHGAPRHRDAVAVEEPGLEQLAHHHGDAAHPVDVHHVVLAVGLRVGDVRHPRRHPVEVVELELDACLVGDGEEMEHGVGRAAERHHHGDGVLERRLWS